MKSKWKRKQAPIEPEPQPEPDRQMLVNGELIRSLSSSAVYADKDLGRCPKYLRETLETNAWREFASGLYNKVCRYGADQFDQFVRAKWPEGLGVPTGVDALITICKSLPGDDSDAALRLLREVTPALPAWGGDRKSEKATDQDNNIILKNGDANIIPVSPKPKQGTAAAYTLRRLKRDNPELARKVEKGEISANKAAQIAGFRPKMFQAPHTVDGVVRGIVVGFTAEERQQIADMLNAPLALPQTRKKLRRVK